MRTLVVLAVVLRCSLVLAVVTLMPRQVLHKEMEALVTLLKLADD